jgi:pimeloyl-ACP methyl ester carboxylesterase
MKVINQPKNKNHIIIFSHGTGVRKDDRGLLTDIADALPEAESILFDYYEVDEAQKTLTTCPFSVQVKKLNQIVEEVKINNPVAIIDFIAHSQGTIITALARPDGIRKAVLLAPVFDVGLERTLLRYKDKPGAKINLNGLSKLPPLDGLIRIVPAKYWQEREKTEPIGEYNAFSKKTELIVIEANQDELLAKVDLTDLNHNIKFISLDGDHGFNNEAREPLISAIRKLLL